jgi:transcriptional regulator with XRE-family HTH domain
MNMNNLGEFIRQKREELDISLRELAKKIGVSAAFLSDIELGRRNPSDDVMKKLARELKVTLAELSTKDARAPVEDLKRLSNSDPAFGYALRRLVKGVEEKKISADDVIKFADKKPTRGKAE